MIVSTPEQLKLLGLDVLDKDHDHILGILKSLAESGEPVSADQHSDLIAYITRHCAKEESFLKKIKYPDTEAHRKLHASLQTKFMTLLPHLVSHSDRNQYLQALYNLESVFKYHILHEDIKYIKFLGLATDMPIED